MIEHCPCCGAGRKRYTAPDDNFYETWTFYCDGEIMRWDSGKFTANEPCGNAMRNAVKRLNDATPHAPHVKQPE